MASLRISALFLIMLFITGLSACGKTGPLYLPDDSVKQEKAEEQPTNLDTYY